MGDICFVKVLKECCGNMSASSLVASMFAVFAGCPVYLSTAKFVVEDREDLEEAAIKARESSTAYLGT
jgi:hypothetical protein